MHRPRLPEFSHILNGFDDSFFSPNAQSPNHTHRFLSPRFPCGPYITEKEQKNTENLKKNPTTTSDKTILVRPLSLAPTTVLSLQPHLSRVDTSSALALASPLTGPHAACTTPHILLATC